MSAIDNIRRDLKTAAWLRWSDKPFAGAVHDFSRPLRERFKAREYVSPYYWSPTAPGKGRSFYQHSKHFAVGDSTFKLRIEEANEHLRGSRLSFVRGYYVDDFQDDSLQPIIARLPHGRGYLAGWTMGRGMAGVLDAYIWPDIEDAARAAHDLAEHDAEKEREYQESQDEDEDEDEDEDKNE